MWVNLRAGQFAGMVCEVNPMHTDMGGDFFGQGLRLDAATLIVDDPVKRSKLWHLAPLKWWLQMHGGDANQTA